MDIIKILKLVSMAASLIGTASGYILKPKMEAAKDEHMQRLIEEAVANAINKEKGL